MVSLLGFLSFLLVPAAQAVDEGDPGRLLAQLSALELAPDDVHRVRDLTLRRDVVSVSFSRGVLAFLEPVEGTVTGAVFIGSGDVLVIPPDDIERHQLHKFTGSPILSERFDAAILRFTDDTREEVLDLIRSRAEEEVRADDLEALLPWGENLGETSRLLNLRLLQDLMGRRDRPIFFGALRGETLGWFDVLFDQRSVEEVTVGSPGRGEARTRLRDIWASFNRRDEARDPTVYGLEAAEDVDVLAYDIDTTIGADGGFRAVAGMSFLAKRAGERVLQFSLTRSLALSDVRFEGASVPFFQHEASAAPVAGGNLDRFVVALPRATAEGEELRIEFDYAGPVLERRGNGVYYVSERVLWYPHVGTLDPARYELSFHYPREQVLVATGRLVAQWEAGGQSHSTWSSGEEFVVAGFNYGDFSIASDETGSVPIYVHVNNDVETVFEELASRRAARAEDALSALQSLWTWRGRVARRVPVFPNYELFSTRRLAGNVVGQVRSIVGFFSGTLGEYPFDRLSVSQFPVRFSQGWPSLLYVSTFSFFDREQRALLGLGPADGLTNTEYVLAHEIAHQWFGNTVSWRSYRDQWIGEGFSNYMALLYLENTDGSPNRSRQILSDLKRGLLSGTGPGLTYDDNGPVWIGQRLATSSLPDGYSETVYPKATWIVHMLRMLMQDPADGSDERFLSMVREYLDEFAGGPATTWDLKAAGERHMTARMDPEGDGTLDWFFDQWVFGTGVPEYVLDYEIRAAASGFTVTGRISERRGLDFGVPLPVYARMSGGDLRYVRDIVVSGDGAEFSLDFSSRPAQIVLDPYEAVLRR